MYRRKLVMILIPIALFALSIAVVQVASALPATGSLNAPAAAAQPTSPELAAPDASVWSPNCTPDQVAVYESRLHIHCTQGVADGAATISYWALPATKAQFANRFLSLGSTALVAGRQLQFLYTQGDTSGAAFGCGATDCRNVYAIMLR